METFLFSYWWLLFPLAWFIAAGWSSWLRYRRQKDTLDLIRRYADKGEQPPAELLRMIDRSTSDDGASEGRAGYGGRSDIEFPWQAQMVLFIVLAGGFGWAAWTDLYGAGGAFGIVTFVMGAVAAMYLVAGLARMVRRR